MVLTPVVYEVLSENRTGGDGSERPEKTVDSG